jgi:hypothetical protein
MPADCYRKVFATMFTSVAAPVLVSVIVQQLGTAPQTSATPPSAIEREPRDIVVSHGVGTTPREARREALRAALLQIASSLNDGAVPTVTDRATCEVILDEPREVILRCEDLAGRNQVEAGRSWYYQEVSVEVARAAWARRLLAARMELVVR